MNSPFVGILIRNLTETTVYITDCSFDSSVSEFADFVSFTRCPKGKSLPTTVRFFFIH